MSHDDGLPGGSVNQSLLKIPMTAHILGCCIGAGARVG